MPPLLPPRNSHSRPTVLDFQAENDYIPFVKMAATGKKGRKKGKIQRREVSLQSGFRAPAR